MSISPMEDSEKSANPVETKEKKPKKEKKDTAEVVAGKKRKRSEVESEESAAPAAVDEEIPLPPDEAPLSHKQLRKVKKKKSTTAEAGDSPTEQKAPKPAGNTSDKPIRQNSIWVGNLAFKTSESDIREFFAPCGEITRINMPRKVGAGPGGGMRGQNMGFAYVDFESADGREKAVKMSESPLHGRKLLIKDGNDYRGRPSAAQKAAAVEGETSEGTISKPAMTKTAQKILKSQKHPPGPTLFVGNLGFDTTEETIKQMLEGHHRAAHGEKKGEKEKEDEVEMGDGPEEKAERRKELPELGLRKIRLGTFEDSGVCKGWAFIDFHETAQAQAVLINGRNHFLNGRKLLVEFASADAVRRGGHPSAFPKKGEGEAEEGKRGKKFGGGKSKGYHKKEKERGKRDEGGAGEEVPSAFPTPAGAGDERPAKRQKGGRERPQSAAHGAGAARGGDKPARRLKPGAALALAVQSTAKTGAIVASKGKKITFD